MAQAERILVESADSHPETIPPVSRERISLPIDPYLEDIARFMDTHQITIVQGPPGCGKTLRILPYYLATRADFFADQPGMRCLITEQKRAAVTMNASRMARQEFGQDIGDTVGFSLRRKLPRRSASTKIHFLIDQTLHNQLISSHTLPAGILAVDEAHTNTNVTIELLHQISEKLKVSPDTQVLIMSATMQSDAMADYYRQDEAYRDQVAVFKVPDIARPHPVDIEPYRLGNREHHTEGAIAAAKEVALKYKNGELTIPVSETARATVTQGTCIVLLPGKDDIEAAKDALEEYAEKLGMADRIETAVCHGELPVEEQDKVAVSGPPHKLRFVFATEIIRSSVTVADAVVLIDSLQVKRSFMDQWGVKRLAKIPVSGIEIIQAWGRLGRTGGGVYIPVSFGTEYERLTDPTNPDYWPTPEILRTSVSDVALALASEGYDLQTARLLVKPDAGRIVQAVASLTRIGALDESGRITKYGRELLRYSIDPELAHALAQSARYGLLPEEVISIGHVANEGVFQYFKKTKDSLFVFARSLQLLEEALNLDLTDAPWIVSHPDGQYELMCTSSTLPAALAKGIREQGPNYIAQLVRAHVFADTVASDLALLVNAYRQFVTFRKKLLANYSNNHVNWKEVKAELYQWCTDRFINFRRMRLVEQTIRDIEADIEGSDLSKLLAAHPVASPRQFDAAQLARALVEGMPDHVIVRDGDKYHGPLGKNNRGDDVVVLLSHTSAADRASPLLFVGSIRKPELQTGREAYFVFADLAAPIDLAWLVETGNPFLSFEPDPDRPYELDWERNQIRTFARVFYAGHPVTDAYAIPRELPAELISAVLAETIVSGLLPHPHHDINLVTLTRLQSLMHRAHLPAEKATLTLQSIYRQRLAAHGCRGPRDVTAVDLQLTDSDREAIVDTDLTLSEWERKVLHAWPDQAYIDGIPVQVTYVRPETTLYSSSWYTRYPYARLDVPENLLTTLTWQALPIFEGYHLHLYYNGELIATNQTEFSLWQTARKSRTVHASSPVFPQQPTRNEIDKLARLDTLLSAPVEELKDAVQDSKRFKRMDTLLQRWHLVAIMTKGHEGASFVLRHGLTDQEVADIGKSLEVLEKTLTKSHDSTNMVLATVKGAYDAFVRYRTYCRSISVQEAIREFAGGDTAFENDLWEIVYRTMPDLSGKTAAEKRNIIAELLNKETA